VFDLIRAFGWSGVELRRAQLVMIGEGPDQEEAQELVERLNLPIVFLGARPHAEIARWLAAADLLTLPSWNEGTPNVVLEALAAGRRVVATSVGGTLDVVNSTVLGELVAPRDLAAFAEAFERVLATPFDPEAVSSARDAPDWKGRAHRLYDSLSAALASRASEAA